MGRGVLIVGAPGSGKSTSTRNMGKDTFIINVYKSELPYKGFKTKFPPVESLPPTKGNYIETKDVKSILKIIEYISSKRPDIKNIVLDDTQYIFADEFMEKADQKGYQKFTDIGKHIWQVARSFKNLREDMVLYFMWHPEETTAPDGTRYMKAKTVGKLIDNYLTLEGMFTVVLFAEVIRIGPKHEYSFIHQSDGTTTAKAPMDMFPEGPMPNDLVKVRQALEEYYD